VNDRLKKLQTISKKLNKNGTIIQFASEIVDKFKFYSSPWPVVNQLIKGFPRARFTIIAGVSQSGKTALTLQQIAHLQKEDPDFIALWIDFENAWDGNWAQTLGVDLERVVLLQYCEDLPNMERVFDKAVELMKTQCIDMMVIDSIGALTPRADIEDKSGDRSLEKANMLNLQTKLGEIFRKLNIIIAPNVSAGFDGVAVIMLGHVYQEPNQQGFTIHHVRGGNAVKHWAHIRLAMTRGPRGDWPEKIKLRGLDDREKLVYPGFSCRIILEKTRTNKNEGQEIALKFFHGRGFDYAQSTVSAALRLDIIDRKGGWFYSDLLPDGKIQGREKVEQFFEKNPEPYHELATMVDTFTAIENDNPDDEVTDESEHH